jgi:hypothetical protein
MTGWRLIGIIASVISFFGFGVFLWNQSVEDAVAPYAQDLRICSALEQYSDKFWQENARDPEELSEKLQVNQDQYEKCALKAKLQWESERPSDSVLAIVVLVIDLGTIALGWLIVWGCVVLAVGCALVIDALDPNERKHLSKATDVLAACRTCCVWLGRII